jgi:hypothetical protein
MVGMRVAVISALGILISSPAPATGGSSGGWGGPASRGGHSYHCPGGHRDCARAAATQEAPSSQSNSSGKPVPEPSDFALFALGVLGLVIGRRSSRARRRQG